MVADGFGEVGGVGLVRLGLGDVLPGVLVGRRAVGGGRVSVAGLGHGEKVLPRTTKDTREALDVLDFRISLVSGHSSGYPHPAPTVSNKNPKISKIPVVSGGCLRSHRSEGPKQAPLPPIGHSGSLGTGHDPWTSGS